MSSNQKCSFKFENIRGQIEECQFTDEQHFYHHGLNENLCIFHMPPSEDQDVINIKWSEAGKNNFKQRISSLIEFDLKRNEKVIKLQGVHFSSHLLLYSLESKNTEFDFSKAVFHEGISITECKFFRPVSFWQSQFKGRVSFLSCYFHNGLSFWKAHFERNLSFNSISSRAAISFDDSIFSGDLEFTKNDFSMFTMELSPSQFLKENEDDVVSRIKFVECSFGNEAFEGSLGKTSFSKRKFVGSTIFDRCIFKSAPEFHGCNFYQDTRFSYCQFLDTTSDEAESAYRTLRLVTHNSKNKTAESLFFGLEKQSTEFRNVEYLNSSSLRFLHRFAEHVQLRGVGVSIWKTGKKLFYIFSPKKIKSFIPILPSDFVSVIRNKYPGIRHNSDYFTETALSMLYRIFSDYGNSIARPVAWLIYLTFIIFPSIYFLVFLFDKITISSNGQNIALGVWEYSLLQVIKPFSIFGISEKSRLINVSFIISTISLIQSTVSLILLALIVLATGRRFKM